MGSTLRPKRRRGSRPAAARAASITSVSVGVVAGLRNRDQQRLSPPDDEGIPEIEPLVPTALDRRRDVRFRQARESVAVIGLIHDIDHSVRPCDAAGLVDHVDRDRQVLLHFGP